MPSPDPNAELLDLLDALCEERLTAEQTARLERIVLGDRAARKLYLNYLHVHGTLLWDAAQGDGASVPAAAEVFESQAGVVTPAKPVPDRRARRAWLLTAAGTACLVAVALLGWWLSPPHAAPQVAQGPRPPAGDDGGNADEHRRFEPIKIPDRPVPRPDGTANPIIAVRPPEKITPPADIVAYVDERIEQGWKDAGVEPSPVASDAEWLRRVYLDLAGHIPPAAEVERFLADGSPDKRGKVVDSLLANDDFDRHFATVWTNLLVGRAASPLADRGALFAYLRKSFAENKRWDQTVASFVAAEGPIDADPAANFLVAHLNNQAVPATAITARVFLGTQVQCMQCHNHPFNKWTQQDFWELNSFFQQTALTRDDKGKPAVVSKQTGGPTLFENRAGLMLAAYPKYHGHDVSDAPTVNRRTALAKLLAEGDNPQLALAFVNRVWAQLLGAGFTNPIDDMGPHNPPSHPEALDRLSRSFVASGYDVRQLVRWITATKAYGLSSRFGATNTADDPDAGETPLFSRAYPKSMSAEQVYDSLLVATRADGPSEGERAGREEWVRQFVRAYQTDENDESVNFEGSVPQALALMNGDTVRDSIAAAPGTTVYAALKSSGDDAAKLRRLALAALSRPLEPKESAALRRLVRQQAAAARRPEGYAEALQDAFWAMLNSAEFVAVP